MGSVLRGLNILLVSIYNFRTRARESVERPLPCSRMCDMLLQRADRDAHGGGRRAIWTGRAEVWAEQQGRK